jgi:diguanylate cyclase (GGDEF)-like protein/PAS domain S-box-containing protein
VTEEQPGRLSRLSGEFVETHAEAEYRSVSSNAQLRRLKFVSLVSGLFYLAGFTVDFRLVGLGDSLWWLLGIRIVVSSALGIGFVFMTTDRVGFRSLDSIVLVCGTMVGLGTSAIIAISRGEIVFHSLTVFVILLVFYLFVPARFWAVVSIAAVTTGGFVVVALLWLSPLAEEMALVLLYLAVVNLLGTYTRRQFHRAQRLTFLNLETERTAHQTLRNEMRSRADVESALIESEERHRSLVELSPNAIIVHRNGEILYINPRGAELMGASEVSELLGRSIFEYILPKYHEIATQRLDRLVSGLKKNEPREVEVRTSDGRTVYCEVVSGHTTFDGRDAIQSVIQDIAERKRLEDELVLLATTDPLTGAFNRRHFFEHFEVEWARARRHGRNLSILIMDLDHFKSINDAHGHATGDAVLKAVVSECRGLLRAEDLLARIGGEEFAMVLPEIDEGGAAQAAERIRERMASINWTVDDVELQFTVSLGVAECQIGDETPDDSLKRADRALYVAKDAGRNAVRVG